jgi:hypothetical protein
MVSVLLTSDGEDVGIVGNVTDGRSIKWASRAGNKPKEK